MKKGKILIADDSAFLRMTMREMLVREDYDVVGEVSSGEEAVETYQSVKPDLVTMDLVMIGAGGIPAVKKILHHDPRAKILVVSAMGQEALVVQAIQAGAKGFLVKPVEPEKLLTEVARILRLTQMEGRQDATR